MDTTTIAESMERDIALLKSARPQLTSRIERAEHILVAQLSTTNGSRPVKVRVHADGTRSYTVRSGSKLCRSYNVDQTSWECECPDHRRSQRRGQRSSACKHALACWVLERAYGPASAPLSLPEPLGECAGCGGRFAGRELTELTEDNHDGLTYFDGGQLCRACTDNAGVER